MSLNPEYLRDQEEQKASAQRAYEKQVNANASPAYEVAGAVSQEPLIVRLRRRRDDGIYAANKYARAVSILEIHPEFEDFLELLKIT